MIPQNYIKLEGDEAKRMLKLYEAVDDNDDVQNIYANFDIDESEME
jgi:transcriptional/translational regulatory protein YebC/TACO1